MNPSVTWREMPPGESFSSEATLRLPAQKSSEYLYLYFDESGNLDFKASGTPYFIMTCAAARRPFFAGHLLGELRYILMEHGLDIEKFHACEDKDNVRSLVYSALSRTGGEYNVYSIFVDKAIVPEEFRTADRIYSKVFELIFDEVYERESNEELKRVIAITDRLPKDAAKRQVSKPLKRYMKSKFQSKGVPYQLMHHDSASDLNLQAADYFCWAAQRDLAQRKSWPMSKVYKSFVEVGELTFPKTEEADAARTPAPTTRSPISRAEEPPGFVSVNGNL